MTQDKGRKVAAKKQKPDAALSETEQRIAELTEALQRERADAENLRRRHNEQMVNLKTIAKADVVRELLPVIDNVERALGHVPDELKDDDFVKGVQGIGKQFARTLEQLGVEKIKTVGEPFDPNLHEAVSVEQGDGNQEIISGELQPGYKIGNKVLRPAMVRVAH